MFEKILLPVDGSPQSEKAVRLAAELAAPAGDQVTVMHVIELVPAKMGPVQLESREDAETLVERYAKELADAGVHATTKVARAFQWRIGWVVVEAASDLDADVIVMGCRGRSDLSSLLLGSVAHEVLQHSHCPVLIAR